MFKETIETAEKFFNKNKYIFVTEFASEFIFQKKSIFIIYLNFVILISILIITIKNNSISTAIINSIFQISLACFINSIVFIDLTVKKLELFVKLLFFQQADIIFFYCLFVSFLKLLDILNKIFVYNIERLFGSEREIKKLLYLLK